MRNIDNFIFGDIVVADLPYADGLKTKIRPVLILAKDKNDYLLMKITSNTENRDPIDVSLHKDSYNNIEEEESLIKIKKIWTRSKEILIQKIWILSDKHHELVKKSLQNFIDWL